MPVPPRDFAVRVAAECAEARARLTDLQATFGDEMPGSAVTPRLLADVQALDAVCQTLADLGQIFATLGQDGPHRCGPDGIPDSAIACAFQASLRGRLVGRLREIDDGGVDLF